MWVLRGFLLWLFVIVLIRPIDLFAAEKLKVAVTDLDALGVPENVALSASELFRTELFKTGYFHVLERRQMKKVMEEQALSLSGALDPSDAAKIGKLLTVHLIVFGSINQLGNDIVVNIRLVDVEEGRLKAADTANARELEEIPLAVKALSKVISAATPLRGKVVKIRGDEVVVSLGSLDQITKGDFLRVQRLGEDFKDPATGQTLGREIIEVATLKVEQIINEGLSSTLLVQEYGAVKSGDIVIIWAAGDKESRPTVRDKPEIERAPPSQKDFPKMEEPLPPKPPSSGQEKRVLPPPTF